jgi:crotonobetainyl-CoA:carnitine CoA-transferase CaiB-like acyl-CoA transferase
MADSEPCRFKGPFSGPLIVDVTDALNGPVGTTILNDLGARVIGSPSSRTLTSQVNRSF